MSSFVCCKVISRPTKCFIANCASKLRATKRIPGKRFELRLWRLINLLLTVNNYSLLVNQLLFKSILRRLRKILICNQELMSFKCLKNSDFGERKQKLWQRKQRLRRFESVRQYIKMSIERFLRSTTTRLVNKTFFFLDLFTPKQWQGKFR